MNLRMVVEYFRPHQRDGWQWETQEKILQWLDGRTITFVAEIHAVLNRQLERGFPEFSCIVLILAALRDNWTSGFWASEDRWEEYQRSMKLAAATSESGTLTITFDKSSSELASAAPTPHRTFLTYIEGLGFPSPKADRLLKGLNGIHELASKDCHSIDLRIELVAMISEQLPVRCLAADTRLHLDSLAELGVFLHDVRTPKDVNSSRHLLADLSRLIIALEGFDVEHFRRRIETGVIEPIRPALEVADEYFSDSAEARGLIQSLILQTEWSSLGRCAQSLLAALYQPAPMKPTLTLHHEGFSDITNRGDISRLLISELAYDNELLAIRILHGESLYMRRETPPTSRVDDRFLFIDNGLGTWGITRWYIASIAIAWTAAASAKANVFAWRPNSERGVDRSFFTDEAGMRDHLAALDSSLHPGESLEAFTKVVEANPRDSEVFFLFSQTAWKSHDFRQMLRDNSIQYATIAIIDRTGALELFLKTPSGMTLWKTIDLSIAVEVPESIKKPDRLPKIFQRAFFPLRQSPVNLNFYPVDTNLLLGWSPSRRIYLLDDPKRGAIELVSKLPSGTIRWAGLDATQRCLGVVWGSENAKECTFLRFSMNDHSLVSRQVFSLDDTSPQFCIQDNLLVIIGAKSRFIQAWDFQREQLLSIRKPPEWRHGTMSVDSNQRWNYITFSDAGVQSETILMDPNEPNAPFLHVSPNPRRNGFWGIDMKWHFRSSTLNSSGQKEKWEAELGNIVPNTIRMLGDNRWLQFENALGAYYVRIQDDGSLGPLYRQPAHPVAVVWPDHTRLTVHSYRNRFHQIGLIHGQLTLARDRNFFVLCFRNGVLIWEPQTNCVPTQFDSISPFQCERDLEKEFGKRLERATRNGVEAILDGQGFLHLRWPDGSPTEITFVLADGAASGWLSDERWFGKPYYCMGQPVISDEVVFRSILTPMLEALA